MQVSAFWSSMLPMRTSLNLSQPCGLVELGQLGADLAADGLGVHADIGHHLLVAGVDVVVDGDQPDAGFLRLLRDHRAQRLVGDDDGDRL